MTTLIQPARKQSIQYGVPALLALSSGLLSSLVPGGPIETRSFAHINPFVLGGFNTFLTTLSLANLLLVYFGWQRRRWAFAASAAVGLSYFLVYGLDLGRLFPVSPDTMPPALLAIEILGTIVSLPLIIFSGMGFQRNGKVSKSASRPASNGLNSVQQILMVVGIMLIGMGIITFATRSAMGL